MEVLKQKKIFVIKVSLPWEWHRIFDEILDFKSFPLPPLIPLTKWAGSVIT